VNLNPLGIVSAIGISLWNSTASIIKGAGVVLTYARAIAWAPITFVEIAVASCVYAGFDADKWGDVWEDWKNFSFFNDDPQKCLDAKVFSSYRGSPVIRQSNKSSCGIFNTIFLSTKGGDGKLANDLNHEWGHLVQETFLGPNYIPLVAIPSLITHEIDPRDRYYYSMPWERTADFFGESKRNFNYYPSF
jgi:hypothetical protein